MTLILQKIIGIIIVCAAALLFVFSTTHLNNAQDIGGLMSGVLSTSELIILTIVLDAVAVCLAFGGIKFAGLKKNFVGFVLVSTGIACLVLGILNHLYAPPNDGANDTGKIPVHIILHILTYATAIICLFSSGYLLKSRKIT